MIPNDDFVSVSEPLEAKRPGSPNLGRTRKQLNLYLVRSNEMYGRYEGWWELIVIAENEEEAKKINYPHPTLGSKLFWDSNDECNLSHPFFLYGSYEHLKQLADEN